MRQHEHGEQVALCRWLTLKGIGFAAIPNGGHRHISVARKLKAEGVKAGLPDVLLYPQTKCGRHVFIELKRATVRGQPKGRVSHEQQAVHETLRANGWIVIVAHGWQDAAEQLERDVLFVPRTA